MRGFLPGYTPRIRFSCEVSFTLSFFPGDEVSESTPTCIVGSAGSGFFHHLGFYLVLWSLVHRIFHQGIPYGIIH